MKDFASASAPGRVCFAGEDLDWIIGPSLLGAINLRTTVHVRRIDPQNRHIILRSASPFNFETTIPIDKIGQYKGEVMDYSQAAIKILLEQGFLSQVCPIEINVSTTLPAKAGLSSSAAVSVATLAALNDFFDLKIPTDQICGLAYLIEKEELATGAGQMDFYPCGLGGLIYIDSSSVPPNPIEKYTLPPEYEIIVADTMTPRNTKDVIHMKRQRYSDREASILTYIKLTNEAVQQMRTILSTSQSDISEFGKNIVLCHEYLRDNMKVSTQLLEACVDVCLEAGAIGAKLTGTGMGGCMFALVHTDDAERVKNALKNLQVEIFHTTLSTEGIIYGLSK